MAWTLRVGLWFSCMTFSGLIRPGDKNCVRRDTELGVDFTSASVPKTDLWVRVSCKAKVQVLLTHPIVPWSLSSRRSSNRKAATANHRVVSQNNKHGEGYSQSSSHHAPFVEGQLVPEYWHKQQL